LAYLITCPSWNYLVAGSAIFSITGYGVLMWGYEFYGRVHGMAPLEIGVWMAGIVGIGGSLGAYGGGRVVDRLAAQDHGWYMRMPAIVSLVGLPFAFLFLLSDSRLVSLLSFFPFYLLANVYVPALHTVNQNLAKLRMRATAAALILFVVNIVGAGAGPLIVGVLNDLFAPRFGDEAIRYSLATLASTGVIGSLMFFMSSRTLAKDMARAKE
jgi:hypothetical protein